MLTRQAVVLERGRESCDTRPASAEAPAWQPSLFAAIQGKSGGKGIRTPGLLIANETLYQLSYTPILPIKNGTRILAEICACPAILSGMHSRANENTSEECIPKSRRVFVPLFIERCLLCAL